MKYYILLLLIVLGAGFLRIYQLGRYPVGFHIDEASLGYNGYSMLKTGKDEHGHRFPLYIDMFGDNRPSGYHYLTIIPIAIFGLNEFATRLPGAVFGTLTVIVFYFFVFALFKDRKLALFSSFLIAISPWHVVSSRASAEAIVALFFIIAGFTCIFYSLRNKNTRFLIPGFISLILSFQFYHTPRVFVPLLILCIFAVLIKKASIYPKKIIVTSIVCFIVLSFVSFLLVFVIKGGTARFSQVSVFGSPETRLVMEEQFREDGVKGVSPDIARFFHNKIINYSYTYISNYFDYFTGSFLFLKGGKPLWYNVPSIGMLNLFELPFIVIGFVYLLTQDDLLLKLPILWLFVAPLVAAITTDDIPNVQRVMVMFPMFEILAAYGFFKVLYFIPKSKKLIATIFLSIVIAYNFVFFLHQYFVHAAVHVTIYRFNGFKEMVLAVKKEYNNYDHVIISKTAGGMYPHVLFFMQYDPSTYQKEGSPKDPDFGGFGKFIFVPEICPSINGDARLPKTGRILYVDNGTCDIPTVFKQRKIYREDGSLAFILVSNNQFINTTPVK